MAKINVNGNKAQSTIREVLDRINGGGQRGAMTDYLRAHAMGWAAGYRSTAPFTAMTWTRNEVDNRLPSHLIDAPGANIVTAVASVGEAIADKLPGIPSRLTPVPFIVRLVSGGLAGTIIAQRSNRSPVVGALLGGAGAGLGSVAGYCSREILDQKTGIPDPVWGIMEDVLALGLGLLAAL